MRCPKCDHTQNNRIECEACGLIFKKYEQFLERKKNKEKSSPEEKSGVFLKFSQVLLLILVTTGITYYYLDNKNNAEAPPQASIEVMEETDEESPIEEPRQERVRSHQQPAPESYMPQSTPIEQARNATVSIETPWGMGSGFFITEQFIITNKHVVEFDSKKLYEYKQQVEKGRKIIELEKEKIAKLKRKRRNLSNRPTRDQLSIIIQSMEENLEKYLPQQEKNEEKLAMLEQGASPSDIKIVMSDGSEHSANYLIVSENYDLALMSLYREEPNYLRRPPTDQNLRQGDKVYTIGSPVGLRHTVTAGIFSGYRVRENSNERYLQTDAAINPGNSGGPLIDERGFVYGVNTMILRNTEGIGFAIPIDRVFEEFGSELY